MLPMLLAGAAMSGLGSVLGSKSSKPGGFTEIKPQWYQNPGSEGAYSKAWGNIQNQQEALSRGELPSYYLKYRQQARKRLSDPLYNTYFGGGGSYGPGMINRSMEAASIAGAGPKGAVSQARKAMWDYNNQAQQIDYTLGQQDFEQFGNMQNNANWVAENSGSWQKSDYMQNPAKTNPWMAALGGAMQGAGGGMMLGSMFGGGGGGGQNIGGGYTSNGIYAPSRVKF